MAFRNFKHVTLDINASTNDSPLYQSAPGFLKLNFVGSFRPVGTLDHVPCVYSLLILLRIPYPVIRTSKSDVYQGILVSCKAHTGFAPFGKELQLISGSPYVETEQLPNRISEKLCVLTRCGCCRCFVK